MWTGSEEGTMAKINVTNKHDASLDVAGTPVRPGATAAVEQSDFDVWSKGHAAGIWLKEGLIVKGGKSGDAVKEVKADPVDTASTTASGKVDRAAYLTRAKELGLDLKTNVSNADLVTAVNEAEVKKAQENTGDAG